MNVVEWLTLVPKELDTRARAAHERARAEVPDKTAVAFSDFAVALVLNGLALVEADLEQRKRAGSLIQPATTMPVSQAQRDKLRALRQGVAA